MDLTENILKAIEEDKQFLYDAEHPLDSDIVIVDEASMTNVEIFLSFHQLSPKPYS